MPEDNTKPKENSAESGKDTESKASPIKKEVENADKETGKGETESKNDAIELTLDETENLGDVEGDVTEDKTIGADNDDKSADAEKPTESATDDNKEKQPDGKTEEKPATVNSPSEKSAKTSNDSQNRNLWITNISQTTRATELKQALSQHGKVIGAKVVINARYPGGCCYGYVKMETVADADNCIAKLNNTELNGQIIKIEKVRPDHLNPQINKKQEESRTKDKPSNHSSTKKEEKSKDKKDTDVAKDKGAKADDGKKKSVDREKDRSRVRVRHSRSQHRSERSLSSKSKREKERERELLTFEKIKRERELELRREKERLVREERRRKEDLEKLKEIERKQLSEARRLERGREKLREEREKLERERAALMARERERQREEREKLEMEKIELERAKLRIQEEERRTVKRPAPYRDEPYSEKRRAPNDRNFVEAPPPPPRFEGPIRSGDRRQNVNVNPRPTIDKRDSYPPKRDRNYEAKGQPPPLIRSLPPKQNSAVMGFNSNRDMSRRDNPQPSSNSKFALMGKDGHYPEGNRERNRSPHFGQMRDDRGRRPMPMEHKGNMRNNRDHHYEQSKGFGTDSRNFDRGNGHWGPNSDKNFSNSNPNKNWGKDSWRQGNTERWNSGNNRNMGGGSFSNNGNMNSGPSCPPPPGINSYVNNRFNYS